MASEPYSLINLYDRKEQTDERKADALHDKPDFGDLLIGNLDKIALPAAITDQSHPPLTLYFDNNSMKDLWIALTWGI
ncbi:MAG TPA: hypothetical protein VFN35_04575, partial [Ktedonobacteraceae bacterium]|nr:hypothetical protein [Ktedonobacteraceae bacterium]